MRANAAILDVDGTLVNSNDAHAHAFVQAMAEHGYATEFAKIRRLIGMGSDKLLFAAIGIAAESARGKAIDARKKDIFTRRYLPSIRPTRGARELLSHLRDRGLKLVVASSASAETLERILAVGALNEFIEKATSSDDVEDSKPDPDIVLAALKKSGVPARQATMIGDTPYDVAAAQRAGVGVIALRCGGWEGADLAGAAAIYDDPAHLLREIESSPLAFHPVRAAAHKL